MKTTHEATIKSSMLKKRKRNGKMIDSCREGIPYEFAKEELNRCLSEMCPDFNKIEITIGLFQDFGMPTDEKIDAIHIKVENGKGRIAASQKTCVLFAVYYFLQQCGAAWIRPGKSGEYLPRVQLADLSAVFSGRASYQHRGMCIEGAVSVENVLDMIDFIPKYGMNSYFIQFREAHVFFARWYEHRNNPAIPGAPHSVETSRKYTAILIEAIKKRGMQLHMTGHGWTCEPFGIPGLGWDPVDLVLSDETKQHLAMIQGKRDLFGKKPMNTNLCFSQKETRKIVIDSICDYLTNQPQIDVLHLWLSDGSNNTCECEGCRKMQPSDFYVLLLNELDKKLTERGIPAKIAFLIYVDLLWAPKENVIINQDRFLLMFAPITRSYSKSFSSKKIAGESMPYMRNKLVFPQKVEENLYYLKEWQRMFSGDSFIFDYHLMWDHLKDQGYYSSARTIYRDMVNLKNLGLNGNISCQLQRLFLPDAFPVIVMAKTLWNRSVRFEELAREYFSKAYGEDADFVRAHMEKISALYSPKLLRLETKRPSRLLANRYMELLALAKENKAFFENHSHQCEKRYQESFRLLFFHAELLEKMSPALYAFALKDREKCMEFWASAKKYVQMHEMDFQPFLDVFEFIYAYEEIFCREQNYKSTM